MYGAAAGRLLPAADDDVDIAGIEFDQTRAASGPLRRDHRRARSAEQVEDDVAALRRVADRA